MQATLQSIDQLTEHIYSLAFQTERPIDYTAGQFAEFTIDHANPDEKGTRRWFTLSSSPTEPLVAITVKYRQPLSSFKQALTSLRPGDHITMSDPLGDFVLPLDNSLPLLWIAGGIGITPYRSMASWLASHNEQRDIVLLRLARHSSEVIYGDVLASAGITEYGFINTSDRQRPILGDLLAKVDDIAKRLIYISGPETMVTDLEQDLLKDGIGREHIVTDQFLGYS